VTEHRASFFSHAPRDADDRQVNRVPHARAEEADRGSIGAAGSRFAHDFSAIRVSTPAAASNASGLVRMPHAVFDSLPSPGHPLDAAARAYMEPLFGHDFSRVRVHVDASAAESAAAVGANAYTVGQHVVFGRGRFDPASDGGRRLMAHELAHTVQQRSTRTEPLGRAQSREHEAEHAAERVASGRNVSGLTTSGLALACQPSGGMDTPVEDQRAKARTRREEARKLQQFKRSKEWRAYVQAARELAAADARLEAFKKSKDYATLVRLDEAKARLAQVLVERSRKESELTAAKAAEALAREKAAQAEERYRQAMVQAQESARSARFATRLLSVPAAIGHTVEAVVACPLAETGIGAVGCIHGFTSLYSDLDTLVNDNQQPNLFHQAGVGVAKLAGASDETANAVGAGVDTAGSFAALSMPAYYPSPTIETGPVPRLGPPAAEPPTPRGPSVAAEAPPIAEPMPPAAQTAPTTTAPGRSGFMGALAVKLRLLGAPVVRGADEFNVHAPGGAPAEVSTAEPAAVTSPAPMRPGSTAPTPDAPASTQSVATATAPSVRGVPGPSTTQVTTAASGPVDPLPAPTPPAAAVSARVLGSQRPSTVPVTAPGQIGQGQPGAIAAAVGSARQRAQPAAGAGQGQAVRTPHSGTQPSAPTVVAASHSPDVDQMVASYRAATQGTRDIVNVTDNEIAYVFDVTKPQAGRNVANRVIAVSGVSGPSHGARDKSRMAGHPNPSGADRGHLSSRGQGGGYDINLAPQDPRLNRGWSLHGREWRAIERYLADNPGTHFVVRLIYTDDSDWADRFEYSVRQPDGQWRTTHFDNPRPARH
jgi:hypothetical protein